MENIDQKYYCSDYYDISVNKYGVKCRISLRFWENKGWINPIDPYGWFQWYFRYWLGKRSKDDERQIKRWKVIVNSFKDKLMEMIKGVYGKFDPYSISPKIRQILFYPSYELTESDLLLFQIKSHIFISCVKFYLQCDYFLNRILLFLLV